MNVRLWFRVLVSRVCSIGVLKMVLFCSVMVLSWMVGLFLDMVLVVGLLILSVGVVGMVGVMGVWGFCEIWLVLGGVVEVVVVVRVRVLLIRVWDKREECDMGLEKRNVRM